MRGSNAKETLASALSAHKNDANLESVLMHALGRLAIVVRFLPPSKLKRHTWAFFSQCIPGSSSRDASKTLTCE